MNQILFTVEWVVLSNVDNMVALSSGTYVGV